MLRYLTAGESHGYCLTAILEGMPSGLPLKEEEINIELKRRQKGYGRGGRMKIESDRASILSGVRNGVTTGAPIALQILNKDWINWKDIMSTKPFKKNIKKIVTPRPGHADLAGIIKYDTDDIRNILERSSARETAPRAAIGAVCKKLLKQFNIDILSHVIQIGKIKASESTPKDISKIKLSSDKSPCHCISKKAETKMKKEIDKAKKEGYSLGGVFETIALNLPIGLGSFVHWDRKLDGLIAMAILSIQGIKGVEFGDGFSLANLNGNNAHDEIFFNKSKGFVRKTNHAGGIEGGMTNGQPLILRAVMKPISTMKKALSSININTKKQVLAHWERADTCAVPSASIISESVLAFELARAFLDRYGHDSLKKIKLY